MRIAEISDRPDLLSAAVDYFWRHWGNPGNHVFYADCMQYALQAENRLPNFYIVLEENNIIAGYALYPSDIVSRFELTPWLGWLHVNEDHRGMGISSKLLNHGLQEAKRMGYDKLYLSSDLEDFYEKRGWSFFSKAYQIRGKETKIYVRNT